MLFAAKLLREGDNDRVAEEDSDILEAEHRGKRGDHIRLQVPDRGREDTVSVRRGHLQGDAELVVPLRCKGVQSVYSFKDPCGFGVIVYYK